VINVQSSYFSYLYAIIIAIIVVIYLKRISISSIPSDL
jgi:hypothetical protein